MKTLKESFKRVKERPFILIFLGILTMFFCIVEQYNPFTKKYGSFKFILSLDYMENLAKIAQDLKASASSPSIMITSILIGVLLIAAFASIVAIFISGYAQVLYISVLGYKPKKGEFKSGINRNFLKMSLLFITFFIFTILFIVMGAYTIVPAIMSIKMFLVGDSHLIFQMMLIIILTLVLLYFSIIFYSMYWTFSVPGIVGFNNGGFRVALRMVNGYAWYLMPRATFFLLALGLSDILMLALNFGHGKGTGVGILVLIVNWILKLCIVFPYMNFVFSVFVDMKGDMFPSD